MCLLFFTVLGDILLVDSKVIYLSSTGSTLWMVVLKSVLQIKFWLLSIKAPDGHELQETGPGLQIPHKLETDCWRSVPAGPEDTMKLHTWTQQQLHVQHNVLNVATDWYLISFSSLFHLLFFISLMGSFLLVVSGWFLMWLSLITFPHRCLGNTQANIPLLPFTQFTVLLTAVTTLMFSTSCMKLELLRTGRL